MSKLLTIGKYKNTTVDAKIVFHFDKSLIALCDKQSASVSSEVLENVVLQLLNHLGAGNGLVYLFENSTSHNFAHIKNLFASTENSIGKQFFTPREINEFIKNINIELSKRYSLFASAGVKNIVDYNKKQKSKLPNYFIIISGIASLIAQDAELLHILENIIHQGSIGGMFLVINHDIESTKKLDLPKEYSKKFYSFLSDITHNLQGFNFFEEVIPFNNPPEYQRFIEDFDYEVKFRDDFGQSIVEEILQKRESRQQESILQDFLKIKIGEAKAKDAYFSMGDAIFAFHSMISGGTGSGKSTFIQNIILKMCETYSPDDLQLLLFDFGQVSFSPYKNIAHVPYLFNQPNNHEEIVALFEFIHYEIHRRKELFKACGIEHEMVIDNINAYIKHSRQNLPRQMVIIDEFASLLNNSNYVEIASKSIRVNSFATTILNEIAAEGRKAGMHLIMITQSFDSVDMPNAIKPNTSMRIALKAETARDSRATLSNDNDLAYDISQFQAVVNSKAGRTEGNLVVSLDYVSDDELLLRQKDLKNRYPKTIPSQTESFLQQKKEHNKKPQAQQQISVSESHWSSQY